MDVFAAGAVVTRGGWLVLTLNTDDVPPRDGGEPSPVLRVGWVGGGLEPGETPLECLAREAGEELGAAVEVLPAPVARLWDWETERLRTADDPPPGDPLLLVRSQDGRHAVVYVASVDPATPLRPGDDVVGLALLPPRLWPVVEAGATLDELTRAGAELIVTEPLSPETRLWLHPRAFLRVAVPLVLAR